MRLPPFCLRRSYGQGDPLRGGLRPALPSSLAPASGRHDAGSGGISSAPLPFLALGRAHGTCLQVLSAPFGIHSCTFIYPAIAKNFCINLGGFLLSLLNFWGRDFEERYILSRLYFAKSLRPAGLKGRRIPPRPSGCPPTGGWGQRPQSCVLASAWPHALETVHSGKKPPRLRRGFFSPSWPA